MKRFITILTTLLFIFILSSQTNKLRAQNDGTVSDGVEAFVDGQMVYWFYIKLYTVKHPKTKLERFEVRRLGSKVYAGTLEEYDVKLWRHLSAGTKLAIGPFPDYYEAEEALTFYNLRDTTGIDTSINQSHQIFFFPLEVYIRERSRSYGIKRIPAAVIPGSYKSFDYFLRFGLTNKKLAIGPFRNAMVAEEAKRRYRLH
ncbi:MAG: hypothetical protein U9N85_00045 [Bacteroidota bacterium]|nr:hypothetical protein [Bacteroidota bacterium]